ncbi:GNAT family N-acetyltransferase [Nocardia sp. R16R-3T]
MNEPKVEVVGVPERSAYEIRLDGTIVGEELYFDDGAHRVFYATEVDPVFGGRGLGSILIRDALADSVASGRRIVAVCPFVVRWVTRHDDFAANIDEPTSALLQRIPVLPR